MDEVLSSMTDLSRDLNATNLNPNAYQRPNPIVNTSSQVPPLPISGVPNPNFTRRRYLQDKPGIQTSLNSSFQVNQQSTFNLTQINLPQAPPQASFMQNTGVVNEDEEWKRKKAMYAQKYMQQHGIKLSPQKQAPQLVQRTNPLQQAVPQQQPMPQAVPVQYVQYVQVQEPANQV